MNELTLGPLIGMKIRKPQTLALKRVLIKVAHIERGICTHIHIFFLLSSHAYIIYREKAGALWPCGDGRHEELNKAQLSHIMLSALSCHRNNLARAKQVLFLGRSLMVAVAWRVLIELVKRRYL